MGGGMWEGGGRGGGETHQRCLLSPAETNQEGSSANSSSHTSYLSAGCVLHPQDGKYLSPEESNCELISTNLTMSSGISG